MFPSHNKRQDIFLSNEKLLRYLSIPYVWGGKDWTGCDCYGILILFFKEEFKIDLTDFKHGFKGDKDLIGSSYIIEHCADDFVDIAKEDLRFGDCIALRNGSRTPNHCAVMISNKIMLHALKEYGVSTCQFKEWDDGRVWTIRRHKELIDEDKIYTKRFG